MKQILQTLVLASLVILVACQSDYELQSTLTIRGQVIRQFEKSQLSMKDSILDHQNSYISLDDGKQTAFLTEEDYFVLLKLNQQFFNNKEKELHLANTQLNLLPNYINIIRYIIFKEAQNIIVIYNPQISDEDNQVTIYSIDPNTYERVQEFNKPNQIIIKPVSSKIIKYFEEVESFNIMSLLSGQGIFIVIMIFMYICMKNVDMEKLQQQAQEAQQNQPVQN